MKARRPFLILFLFLLPLPLIAAGHDISSIRYAPSDLPAGNATIAYNGKNFLTLWPTPIHIFGSLAGATGAPLGPSFAAVPFASSIVVQSTAAGSGYLAIWNDPVKPTLGVFNAEGVLERRVPLEGDPLIAPLLAFNGTNVLVADRSSQTAIYDLNGRLVNRFLLPTSASDAIAITAIGGDFIVVAAGKSGIKEWRVAVDGTIVSTLAVMPPPINISQSTYEIAVTAKSGRVAMVWTQRGFSTVSSAIIQPDGEINRYVLASALGPVSGPDILPIDGGFLAAWNEQRNLSERKVVAALMTDNGVPFGARPADLGNGSFTSAASSGKTIALTLASSPARLLFADVDAGVISPRAPSPIATPVRQLLPAVAGNGAGFAAAWLDSSSDSQRAMAGRVSATGEALDGPGINLGESGQLRTLAIAHGASGELIVWSAHNHLVAARLTPFGATLDPTPIVIAPLASSAATCRATWNGSRFFVVWTDGMQLFGAFIGADGIASPTRPLSIQDQAQRVVMDPHVAWDGRQFILVYGESQIRGCGDVGCTLTADDIRVLRVSADGIAIDTNPPRIPGFHVRAHVASSGTESLIALDSTFDTTAMIVRDEGGVLQLGPEIPLFHWFSHFGSDVAWTGSLYVVAWRYELLRSGRGWIGAARISQSGTPFGWLFTPAAGSAEMGNFNTSVAANDAGDAAVVISEMAPPAYLARARLYLTSEMAPMPDAPPPPRNVVVYPSGANSSIIWQSDERGDEFLVEASGDSGANWSPVAVTAGAGSTTVNVPANLLFRVRAIGPGGLSEAAVATVGIIERRRAAR